MKKVFTNLGNRYILTLLQKFEVKLKIFKYTLIGGEYMFEQVKNALVESLNIDGGDIKLESNLKDDLGIDSLAAVELSLDLETEFDVEISDEELAALITVEDIVKLIESKQ